MATRYVSPERDIANFIAFAVCVQRSCGYYYTAQRKERAVVPEKVDLEVQLPRAACGPQLARWVMRSWFAGGGADGLLADAELLVSELVTNVLVHGAGHIVLRACLDEDRLLVEVIDQRSTFKRQLWRRDSEQTGRWGLDIVRDISSRWGANEAMTHVWFELEQLRA